MRALLRSRLFTEERGFTLTELLVGMVVGMIVLLAAFGVLDDSTAASGRVTARVDATQRGRLAMQTITRSLRSQACVGPDSTSPTTWLADATPTAVEFYTDLRDEAFRPDRHRVSYDSSASTLTDAVWEGTGTAPTFTFPGSPTRSPVVLTDADPLGGAVFHYYGYATTAPFRATRELNNFSAGALSAADRAQVVRITISFLARPRPEAGGGAPTVASTFQSEVFARLANPQNPAEGSGCA
jgi:prepilin-type N-terminal cleavage/methylation domain-containing protein